MPALPPDIKIAQTRKLRPIEEIGKAIGIFPEELRHYGPHIAKIGEATIGRVRNGRDGKLILVTAMTATASGEGKTVTSIGLGQAFGKKGLKHVVCLREPSLGPTFGFKGGAAGGGMSQALPMEEINLHFTGDMHAITTAHNLLAAMVDNHIFHGNELKIRKDGVVWRRVLDLCDRQLRNCEVGLGTKYDGFPHPSGFDITAASEVMAVLSLAKDRKDLEERLARMVVAYDEWGKPVFAGSLDCVPAMAVLLKEALQPNLVQTIEGTAVLLHCGPFANIAHGCSSVRATALGLKLADYVITEAGFAADLGAEKFLNIKCRQAGLEPSAAVVVVSCRALKLHGGVAQEQVNEENVAALREGLANVRVHVENLRKFGVPLVVAINRFPQDTAEELDEVRRFCEETKVASALSEVAAFGGEGGLELADAVIDLIENQKTTYEPLYSINLPVKSKIEILAREIYRADGVDYKERAEQSIQRLEANDLAGLPLCMAKTQLSISDDKKILGAPENYRLTVSDVQVSNGAGFIVVKTGKVLLMPGMGKHPAVERIGIDKDDQVYGLS